MGLTKKDSALLTPGKEYEDYVEFCKSIENKVVPPEDFYRGAYILAVKGLVSGFDGGVASFDFDGVTLILCKVSDGNLVLTVFKTSSIEQYAKKAEEDKEADPTVHLG